MPRRNHKIGSKFGGQKRINPEEFGIKTEDWRSKIQPAHPTETQDRRDSFRDRVTVQETPTVQAMERPKTLTDEYPKDAVILSMGPASNGKTEKMKELFGEDRVYSFNEMMFINAGREKEEVKTKQQKQQIKQDFFDLISKVIRDADGPIVVDANSLKVDFRQKLYDIIKEAGKTVFIVTYSVPFGEAKRRLSSIFAEKIKELTEQIELAREKGEDTSALEKQLKIEMAKKKKRLHGLKATYDEFLNIDMTLENELAENGMRDKKYPSQVRRIKGRLNEGKNSHGSSEGR